MDILLAIIVITGIAEIIAIAWITITFMKRPAPTEYVTKKEFDAMAEVVKIHIKKINELTERLEVYENQNTNR